MMRPLYQQLSWSLISSDKKSTTQSVCCGTASLWTTCFKLPRLWSKRIVILITSVLNFMLIENVLSYLNFGQDYKLFNTTLNLMLIENVSSHLNFGHFRTMLTTSSMRIPHLVQLFDDREWFLWWDAIFQVGWREVIMVELLKAHLLSSLQTQSVCAIKAFLKCLCLSHHHQNHRCIHKLRHQNLLRTGIEGGTGVYKRPVMSWYLFPTWNKNI